MFISDAASRMHTRASMQSRTGMSAAGGGGFGGADGFGGVGGFGGQLKGICNECGVHMYPEGGEELCMGCHRYQVSLIICCSFLIIFFFCREVIFPLHTVRY